MEFYIDFESLATGASQNPFIAAWFLFRNGGWLVMMIVLLWGFWHVWLNFIRQRWANSIKSVNLAVDVPKGDEQSLKAVENLFEYLAGSQKTPNLIEKYWDGWSQENFSFEIISLGGYIQFIISTPEYYRDMVEAAIYAQYPVAEITEVEDYLKDVPKKFPDEKYDFWGVELQLVKSDYYPIRTYMNFEHTLTQKFADPLSSTLEIMSRLGTGEQAWYQILIEPTNPADVSWQKKAKDGVAKLVGKKVSYKENWFDIIIELPIKLIGFISDLILPDSPFADAQAKKAESQWPSLMQHLTPGEKDVIEAIDKKVSKTTYNAKLRLIYFAEREVFKKAKRIGALFGALKQFNTANLNSFMPSKLITKANYFFVKSRIIYKQTRLMRAFRLRSIWKGQHAGFRLNTEELASLWHFPFLEEVKAPLLQKTESKKGEPPMKLPVELTRIKTEEKKSTADELGAPPTNLPV